MEARVASQPLEPGREGIGGELVRLAVAAVEREVRPQRHHLAEEGVHHGVGPGEERAGHVLLLPGPLHRPEDVAALHGGDLVGLDGGEPRLQQRSPSRRQGAGRPTSS
jgi:hypothetical protein